MGQEKRRTVIKNLIVGMIAPMLPGCSSPPERPAEITHGDYNKVIAYLQALITHDMQTEDLAGLSIAVVSDQHLLWTQGFGWADRDADIPANSKTVYRVGSITKLFTVTAALQFAERNLLDLDAPIQRVLPEFRIGSRFGEAAVTPRLLMTHHAGLPRDLARGMWGKADGSFKEVLEYLAGSELAYPPGEVVSYSNLGLSVLGAAVERLAQQPFAEHVRQAVLAPLGMETASISVQLPASPYLSKAYSDGNAVREPGLRDIAAGGLNASVRDLSRFLMMIFGRGRSEDRAVLKEASVAEMLQVQNAAAPLDLDLRLGLGWQLAPLEGKPLHGAGLMASHSGATIHHRSLMVALPRHKLGVAILCNTANAKGLEKIARTTLAMMLEAMTGIRQPDENPAPTWQATKQTEAAQQVYAGDYVTPAGLVRVTVDGEQMKAQMQGLRVDLLADRAGDLHVRKNILGLIPLPLGDLEEIRFRLEKITGRDVLVAKRGEFRTPFGERISTRMHAGWRDMLGIYLPEIAPDEFPLIERLMLFEAEAMLHLRLYLLKPLANEASGAMLVQTLSDTQGLIGEKLAGCGETIRIRQHAGEMLLELSGYTFRKKTT